MDLNKTWEECLRMWKWISERWDGSESIGLLKIKYIDENEAEGILASCFFCASCSNCRSCPGVFVDPDFYCNNEEYSYEKKPKEFYQELLRLDAIRKEKIKDDAKSPSDIQKD